MNENEFKVRNPFLVLIWSFGLFILMHTSEYLGVLLASSLSGASFDSIISGNFENYLTILGRGLVKFFIGIPLVFLIIKFLWRRKLEWMCLKPNFRLFTYGILLGILLPILIVFILFIFKNVMVTSNGVNFSFMEIASIVVGYLGLTIFTGFAEEIVFRGMTAREIAVKFGWLIAAIISGTYFGLIHLLSNLQNLSILKAVWIILFSIVVGSLLTAMLVRGKSLLLPIGFHIGWNFSLKAVLGTTISGSESKFGLLNTELSGCSILTGGEFGLELSVTSLIFYILLTVLFLKYSKKGEFNLLNSKPQ